jgi:hypothetical protein
MGREEPGDSHPIINEWERERVVSGPGEGCSLNQSMANLRGNIKFL